MGLREKVSESLRRHHPQAGPQKREAERPHAERPHHEEKAEAHPGFKKVQGKIEREGYSKKIAGAILANATRHASASAHRENSHLKRVKG